MKNFLYEQLIKIRQLKKFNELSVVHQVILFWILHAVLMVVGYAAYYTPKSAAVFWPATGFYLGILLISRRREWPWFFIAVVINLVVNDLISYDRSLWVGVLFGLVNSLQAFSGAIFMRYVFRHKLDRLSMQLLITFLVFGAGFSAVLGGTAGAAIVAYINAGGLPLYWAVWQVWVAGDFLGILVIVPVIMSWQALDQAAYRSITSGKKMLELFALASGTFVTAQYVFGTSFTGMTKIYDSPYMLIPFILWGTIRFSPKVVTTGMLILMFMMVFHTDNDLGIFVYLARNANEVMLLLQTFSAFFTVSILFMSTAVSELKISQQNLFRLNDELEARVKQRTAELATVNQELDAFSYSVSHDLKAPLRAVVGYGEMMRGEHGNEMPAGALEYLERIVRSGKQMHKLIEALLSLSRINDKYMSIVPIELEDMIQDLFVEIQEIYSDRELKLKTENCTTVHADRDLLAIILRNLMTNAVKYSKESGAVLLEIGSKQIQGLQVQYVQDNGIGFDMKYARKIFEPFQRLHKAEDYAGSGIGLSIVMRAVQRHGGEVWVESDLGGGTTFYFTLETRME